MEPEQQIEFFRGALTEVGVLEGAGYERLRWDDLCSCKDPACDIGGVTIDNWTCDDLLVGRAFQLLNQVRGVPSSCAACWADHWAAECIDGDCRAVA